MHRALRAAASLAVLVVGCTDPFPPALRATGVIAFSVNALGNGVDPDGLTVTIGGWSTALQPGRSVVRSPLAPGAYTALISGIAPHCFVNGQQPVLVAVAETTSVKLSLECYGDFAFVRHYSDTDLRIFYLTRTGEVVSLTPNLPGRNFLEGWAPDGSRVVFTNEYNGNTDVYTVLLDGTGLRRLTTSPLQDLYPRWSPDGTKIVFHRRTDVAGLYPWGSLHLVNADGSGERPLLDALFHDDDPSWSPDGTQILFSCDRFGRLNFQDVCVIAADGTKPHLGVSVGDAGFGAWSPDGSRVAYMGFGTALQSIRVATLDGSPPINLTPNYVSYNFDWSPDGSRLLLAIADAAGFGFATVKRDGTNLTRLPVTSTSGWANWSPDGSKIVSDLMVANHRVMVVMNPDGSGQRLLELLGDTPTYRALWNPRAHPGIGQSLVSSTATAITPLVPRAVPARGCVELPGRPLTGRGCSLVGQR